MTTTPKKPAPSTGKKTGIRMTEKPISMASWQVDPRRVYADLTRSG